MRIEKIAFSVHYLGNILASSLTHCPYSWGGLATLHDLCLSVEYLLKPTGRKCSEALLCSPLGHAEGRIMFYSPNIRPGLVSGEMDI